MHFGRDNKGIAEPCEHPQTRIQHVGMSSADCQPRQCSASWSLRRAQRSGDWVTCCTLHFIQHFGIPPPSVSSQISCLLAGGTTLSRAFPLCLTAPAHSAGDSRDTGIIRTTAPLGFRRGLDFTLGGCWLVELSWYLSYHHPPTIFKSLHLPLDKRLGSGLPNPHRYNHTR